MKTILEGKLIIAVDFDGTITDEPEIGSKLHLRDNCEDTLNYWSSLSNVKLILWTCRTKDMLTEAIRFLKKQDLYSCFSTTNCQLPEILDKYDVDSRKIGADVYIEDKNIYGTPINWYNLRIRVDTLINQSSCCIKKAIKSCASDTILDHFYELSKLPKRPDNQLIPEIMYTLLAIQYDKEGTYGSSWKGKGEYRGIMSNIDRKYDRLDKITTDEINGTREKMLTDSYNQLLLSPVTPGYKVTTGESKIDAVADLANYCILYMTYLKQNYPGAFEVWMKKNMPVLSLPTKS